MASSGLWSECTSTRRPNSIDENACNQKQWQASLFLSERIFVPSLRESGKRFRLGHCAALLLQIIRSFIRPSNRSPNSQCFAINRKFPTSLTSDKYDFRGHTRGTLVVGIAYGYPYCKGSAIFSFVYFKYHLVKNCLFPTKPLPLCKPLRFVQFGQESCPAGE